MQGQLGAGFQELVLDREAHRVTGLAQDVGDALVRCSEAFGLLQPRKGLHSRQSPIEIHQRCRVSDHHGIKRLDREMGIPVEEVPAQAFADERVKICRDLLAIRRSGGLLGNRLGNQGFQVDVDAAFDQDANDAERGATQAEWIAVASRLLANRKNAGQ